MKSTEIRAVKDAVRLRDRYCCTQCGMTNDAHFQQYRRQLDVHRVEPGSFYSLPACVTVCRRCHAKLPRRRGGQPDIGVPSNNERAAMYLPREQWQQLKLICAVNGENMSDYIARVMAPIVEADYKKALNLLASRGKDAAN